MPAFSFGVTSGGCVLRPRFLDEEAMVGEQCESAMNRVTVDSSSIRSIGYDAISATLEVEFSNGRVYRYFDVPREAHARLMAAESHGAYLNEYIRDAYRFERL